MLSSRISPQIDAFWQEPEETASPTPLKLLILTLPFASGGEEEKMLQNLVKACKLTEEESHILTCGEEDFPLWQHLKKRYTPGVVLNMGIPPEDLSVHATFPFLKPLLFGESYWITVGTPEALLKDADTRKRLWADALKPLFGG